MQNKPFLFWKRDFGLKYGGRKLSMAMKRAKKTTNSACGASQKKTMGEKGPVVRENGVAPHN